jgi:hypothetical protein
MPLISAGDDVFVLLPANDALRFAQDFCLRFEEEMGSADIVQALADMESCPPTMSAAVVFCKQSYPYHLAHQRGERVLNAAKRVDKQDKNKQLHSAVALSFIVGNEMVRQQSKSAQRSGHLTVYWATATPTAQASQRALVLDTLFAERKRLENLPRKRLNELRALFTPKKLKLSEAEWNVELTELYQRIEKSSADSWQRRLLEDSLLALGGGQSIWIVSDDGQANGFLDLYEAWQYLK